MKPMERTDVLVVGARCAGAPLALALARGGKKVLMVDGSELPSDQPMSTHFIQPFGMGLLDELGLGDRVRAIAPPVTTFINGLGDAVAYIELPTAKAGCCPRRADLDALLIDEAKASGAILECSTRLVELLWEGDRVSGGVLEHKGVRREVRADIVVGADGPHSTVAELAGADEYHGYDSPRFAYWAYWPRPDDYGTRDPYRGGAAILHHGDDYYFVFPANRDQLLIGIAQPRAALPEWKGRHREILFEKLRRFPFTSPLVEGEPLSKVIGILKARFFFRQAAGKGWALCGDAGLFKDPTPGLGISDALRDSRALARAIIEGGDEALARYWRQRDVDSIELYNFARDLGEPGYNNPLNQLIFRKLSESQDLRERLIRVLTRELSPFAAFGPWEIVRWTLGALLRGNLGVLKPFLAAGRLGGQVKKELGDKQRLLDSIPAALLASELPSSPVKGART